MCRVQMQSAAGMSVRCRAQRTEWSGLKTGLNGLRIVADVRIMLDLKTAHPRIETWKIGAAAGRNHVVRQIVRTRLAATMDADMRTLRRTRRITTRETTATS